MFSNPVVDRRISGFQLSYSTGIAMETLFDPRMQVFDEDRLQPKRVSYRGYDTLYIHLDTLMRNIIRACEYKDIRQLPVDALGEALVSETELIQSLCTNEGKGLITPVFYLTNYANFYRRKSSEYKLRVPTSDVQRAHFTALISGRAKALSQISVVYAGEEIRPERPTERTLLLSHITPDLLSHDRFAKLELLESHTGKVKTRREWNTKYCNMGSEKFAMMPWCKPLLCWLGDKYTLSPLSITIRRHLLQLAEQRRWSPMTSPSTILNDALTKTTRPEILKVLREVSL